MTLVSRDSLETVPVKRVVSATSEDEGFLGDAFLFTVR